MNNTNITEQAKNWYLRINNDVATSNELFQFNQWLEKPEHAAAYDLLDQLDSAFLELQSSHEGELLVRHSHAAQPATIHKHSKYPWLNWPSWHVFNKLSIGLSGTAFSALVIAYFFIGMQPTVTEYTTKTGETRTITLDDGSVMTLTPETSLTASFGKNSRRVTQHQGHAFFKVAKSPLRPFIVHSGEFKVKVTGTEFSVNTKRETLAVKVSEGRVEVSSKVTAQPVNLSAGTEVSAINRSTLGLRKSSSHDEFEQWKKGVLVYRDTALQVILGELNTYTNHNLYVNSPSLAETRISLSINLHDLDSLPGLLEQLLPVKAINDSYGKIVLLEKNQLN